MIQIVFNKELQEVGKKLQTANKEFTSNSWQAKDRKIQVNWGRLSPNEVDELLTVIRREAAGSGPNSKHYSLIVSKIEAWVSLSAGTSDDTVVSKLELLPAALKGYFQEAKHKWVFVQQEDNSLAPFFFVKAEYIKGHMERGEYIPAVTHLFLKAYKRGEVVSKMWSWGIKDMKVTIPRLLARHRGYRETDEAVTSYQVAFQKYMMLQTQTGLQMQAVGVGQSVNTRNWYSSSTINFVREGIPSKVVVDDSTEENESNNRGSRNSDRFINDGYWGEIPNRNGMVDMDEDLIAEETDEPNQVQLPIHPYIQVFDMAKDQWAIVHTDNLEDYPWDKTLGDKLILKKTDKALINLLCNQTGTQVDDIVKGKMAGVIVLATGTPGIGKTLTAEVFSEMIEKPLYTVQCSQLGLDVNSIEKNLNEILNRAARWGAILLVDEADVYIRRRGDDIQQNAIVGVFLRLLEYYRGVIFMTSNRGAEIDDAILSRATAWIKYEKPDTDMLRQLWEVLGAQYDAVFTTGQLDTIMEYLPNISGRTVRNLLKLARMLVGAEGTIKETTIKQVSNYQTLD